MFICFCLNFVTMMDHIVLTHNLQIVVFFRILNLLSVSKFHITLLLRFFCGLFLFFKLGKTREEMGKQFLPLEV